MILDEMLEKMALYGQREAMITDGESLSYESILEQYRLWTAILRDLGIRSGEVVMLEGDYSPAASGALLALLANGNVAIPLSPQAGHKREQFMSIAQANKYIAVTGTGYRMADRGPVEHPELLKDFLSAGGTGFILFTSGTTGVPKAILHDLSRFIGRYRSPRPALRTISFLLFDHIGGINTWFHTLFNGGTIICPSGRMPEEICALIERHRVELLPASPSFLNLLLMTGADQAYDLSSLKMITYGTEVMSDSTLERLHDRFPQVELRQTYGLSEMGILRAKSVHSGSAWLKIGGEGVETRIVNDVLHIRSQTAMIGYLNAPNPFDEEGWFNTQDVVLQDGEHIRIVGRKSEIINVGGRKVYPLEVEGVLLQMPEIRDVTVKGEANPLLGQVVTASVNVNVPLDARELKRRLTEFCRGKLEDFQIPVKVAVLEGELFSERYKKTR